MSTNSKCPTIRGCDSCLHELETDCVIGCIQRAGLAAVLEFMLVQPGTEAQ